MAAVVIEHVPVSELSAAWQARLPATAGTPVTVTLEPEVPVSTPSSHSLPRTLLSGSGVIGRIGWTCGPAYASCVPSVINENP